VKPVLLTGFRGVVNTEAAERLQALPSRDDPLVDLADAVNVDIDDTGRISRRGGQTMLIPGSAHSLWADGEHCLFVQDGTMYRLDRDMVPAAVALGLDELPMAYVGVGNRVYHSNGNVSAVYENGYVRSWGIDLKATGVSASATTGTLPAGAYLFAMTLLREDGQESGTGLAGRIDLPNNAGVEFGWEVPRDPSLVRAVLYLTEADGETLFKAMEADVTLGRAIYTGGPRALPLATQWLDKPPSGQALALFKGRIYIASGEILFATTALSYEHCDLRDYRAIDGSRILLLAPVEGGLFVGTEQAIWFLGGASFADNALVRKLDGPPIPGTLVSGDLGDILGNEQMAGQRAVMFTTSQGVVLGLPDGSLMNLTVDTYRLPKATVGAAMLRTGRMHQYLLSLDA
jgi:hypothetical protein